MPFEVSFEGIIWIFEKCGYSNESVMFTNLQRLYKKNSSEINKLYSSSGESSIEEILTGLLNDRKIDQKTIKNLSNIKKQLQEDLVDKFWVGVKNYKENVLNSLDYFGIIYFDRNTGKITFFIHPRFSITMFRYLTFMDDKSSIKHMQQIWKIKNDGNFYPKKTLEDLYYNTVKPFKCKILSCIRKYIQQEYEQIFRSGTYKDIIVEFLPTSTDFYNAGILYYKSRLGIKREYNIFSTTSGIFLPEEHYGSRFFNEVINHPSIAEKLSKNEVRKQYFDTLIKCSKMKPRIYHFEVERSKKQFEKILSELSNEERNKYKEKSYEILTKFLNMKCFGLVRVPKFYIGENELAGIFNYLTLGNGSSVLISGRVVDKISHGFWVRPIKKNLIKEAFKEIKLDSILKEIAGFGSSFLSGKYIQEHYFAERFWISFAGPLIYVFLKLGTKKYKEIKDHFVNLAGLIKADMGAEPNFIKLPNKSKPEKSIKDVFDIFE